MFKHIIVPLDGSARAEEALPVAARLVRASGGQLTLLSIVPSTVELDMRPMPLQKAADLASEEDIAKTSNYLTHIAMSKELEGINVRTETLSGSAAKMILLFAQMQHGDLIVMCSRGYSGSRLWTLGGVAEKVVRHSSTPVLMLHEGGTRLLAPAATAARPVRLLVSLDGSPFAETALTPAAQLCAALAAPDHGTLHLCQVLRLPSVTGEDGKHFAEKDEHAIENAKVYLQSVAQHLQQDESAGFGCTVTTSVIVNMDVAETLIQLAAHGEDLNTGEKAGAFDTIVMATHGGGNLAYWIMGSTTERVLHGSKHPLLIVRPEEVASQASQMVQPISQPDALPIENLT
ncbi:MAG TPA: universal stress protein [Ktedonosporobacter sp.]|jgi:nucleotide-binding universal stress UspA family protein|nr:universal stress protein [Ktedonosporobacter sp.]